jgi:glutamate/aspartate transport system substrate-binding protein
MIRTLSAILALTIATSTNAQPATEGTLAKIQQSGAITIGYRESSPPFSYIDDQQKPIGFSLDLCDRIISAIRTNLGLRELKVNYQPVTGANRIPLLQNGTIDMECGSTTNTVDRQKVVSFLLTTFVTGTKLLVKSSSNASSLKDLKGQVVALTAGTNNINAIKAASQRDSLDLKYVYGKDHAESMLLLELDRASAFSTDEILLYSLRANSSNPKQFKVIGELLSEEPYGIMIRKDDPAFKAAGDDVLRGMFKDGSYARIYAKWFTAPIPPRGVSLDFPMSDKVKSIIANPNDQGS